MKAITFVARGKVIYETVADPVIEEPDDVIVAVRGAAICGSDLHPYHEREKGLDPGTVMGHEFVGEIVEAGADVTGLRPGDAVCSPFTTSCGSCFYCRRGLTCRCSSGQLFGWLHEGRGLHGGQAELVRVPLAGGTLMRVPDGVSDEAALLMGDILSTGFFCSEQAGVGDLESGDRAVPGSIFVVVGCGPVGLMTILAARHLGAEELFAVDTVAERLAAAERLGAIPLDYREDPLVDIVREASDGRGADAVMEVVGSRAAVQTAVRMLRPGGVLSSVGVHTEESFGFTPAEAYDKNLTFRSGRCPARAYMRRLAPLVREGEIDAEFVFSHRLPLSEGARGYEIFDRKLDGCTKVLLRP